MQKSTAIWFFAVFMIFGITAAVLSQSQSDIHLHIRSVAANPEHSEFFRENFTREALAAGFTLVNNPREAAYILNLEVQPNVIVFEDGSQEPAPPDEDQFRLRLRLTSNIDNAEVISFSFPFTELREMFNYNADLFYSVMVNVPYAWPEDIQVLEVVREVEVLREVEILRNIEVVREVLVQEPDSWRNQLLYLRASADFPLNYYQRRPNGLFEGTFIYDGPPNNPSRYSRLDDKILIVPGATIGLEAHFLDWMSAELNFQMRFADVIDYAFIPGIGFQLKFPFKPARHFKLSPYAAGSFSMNFADHSVSYPPVALGGGFQFGVKGGENGAWFFDINFMTPLGDVRTKNVINPDFPLPSELRWNKFTVGLGLGYKIGIMSRER
jgi:hypothetical protein